MPDLAIALGRLIEKIDDSRLRYKVYNLLTHFQIPPSIGQAFLEFMMEKGELLNRLGYSLMWQFHQTLYEPYKYN